MSRRTTGGDVLVAATVFALAFLYFYLFHQLGWFLEDEGVLYYHYLRVYQGNVPYRDFFTGYGPIGYYLHAWAFALFGISINAIRVLTAVVNAAAAAGLYLVARRVTSRGFALAPPALFAVMQPWDIAVMVFQNSPYPSWWAIAFAVWGTWAMLRSLEASSRGRCLTWLLLAGVFGGWAFFTKQNTGTFYLWAVTGFLASSPQQPAAGDEPEPWRCRCLRVAYLALIPLATLLLVRNFLGGATLLAFVLPVAALAILGMRRSFGRQAWQNLLWSFASVGAGALFATGPWLFYFGRQMGVGAFLDAILFLGAEVDRNLYVPFPSPTPATLLLMALLFSWMLLAGQRRRAHRRAAAFTSVHPILFAAASTAACIVVVGVWQAAAIRRVLRFEYNLWQIYAFVSESIDNLTAYLSVLALVGGVAVVWRETHTSARRPETRASSFKPHASSLAALVGTLWMAACTFVSYYPRMDYAHLVGAVPLVYVVAAALLPRVRHYVHRAFISRTAPGAMESKLPSPVPLPARGRVREGVAHSAFNLLCLVVVGFVVGTKSAPKVYSRVMVTRDAHGLGFTQTPHESLTLARAHLYFPIYLPRQRLHIDAFQTLVEYLQQTTAPHTPIFVFPALPMVYFLAGRDNPTRHDYFLGDNVSYAEQLDVIRTLEDTSVATVVVDNDPTNYFVAKSTDFTQLIWTYLRQNYYLERRFGSYDVLRRYGSHQPSPDPLGKEGELRLPSPPYQRGVGGG
ncbi:MAG TPA: glycosyltransferase family 39 protein [Candidatus Margulisiibacteriota bacterium]|nr:glycosyltransferase family 39 protein [Candidatus Margulisiibacteriota bacterium]